MKDEFRAKRIPARHQLKQTRIREETMSKLNGKIEGEDCKE